MKSLIISLFTITSLTAQAHFQIGTYDGQNIEGEACSFTIHSVSFKNDMHHPLNELVEMTLHFLNDRKVTMSHLALVDNVNRTVRPKPEVLSYVEATATGAESVEMIMNHDGPQQMVHTIDNYKNKEMSEQSHCMNLKFRE